MFLAWWVRSVSFHGSGWSAAHYKAYVGLKPLISAFWEETTGVSTTLSSEFSFSKITLVKSFAISPWSGRQQPWQTYDPDRVQHGDSYLYSQQHSRSWGRRMASSPKPAYRVRLRSFCLCLPHLPLSLPTFAPTHPPNDPAGIQFNHTEKKPHKWLPGGSSEKGNEKRHRQEHWREEAPKDVTGTFFKNVAAVSLFVAVMRFTPSGDWTRIICCKWSKNVSVPARHPFSKTRTWSLWRLDYWN